jgi:hypothetical protein
MLKKLGYTALLAVSAVALVIGSASTGQAKAKKKMAEMAPPPVFCPLVSAPVCGGTMGVETTYFNSCFAEKSGAKIIYRHACHVYHPAMHHHKTMHKAKKKMAKPAKKKPMKKK